MTLHASEEDPVVAEYDVFITPEMAEQVYLLQYPNRDRGLPYNDGTRMKPLEMRIKPKAGFIELDVPMHVHANFDKRKGITWGEAVREAKDKGSASFGLSSGFGIEHGRIRAPNRGLQGSRSDPSAHQEDHDVVEDLLMSFEDANEKGHVLNKQTLGGQILKEEAGKPLYMLGAFCQKELHLTKVTGIVQMRPQFHYLDAAAQQERMKGRRERELGETPRITEPRAVQMMVKAAADGENVDTATTNKFLQKAEEEPWTRLRYHDEETPRAYDTYADHFFVHDTTNAPKLISALQNEQYLDAISAPRTDSSGRRKERPSAKNRMEAFAESEESQHEANENPTDDEMNDTVGPTDIAT